VEVDPEEEADGSFFWDPGASGPDGDQCLIQGTFTNAASYQLVLRSRNGGHETLTVIPVTSVSTSEISFPLPGRNPGWVALTLVPGTSGAKILITSFQWLLFTVRGTFRQIPAYDVNGGCNPMPVVFPAKRTNAGRLTLTNLAAPIYREGGVAAVQIPEGRMWTDYVYPNGVVNWDAASDIMGQIATTGENFFDEAINGVSIPWRPTSLLDEMYNHGDQSGLDSNSIYDAIEPVSFEDLHTGVVCVFHTAATAEGVTARDGVFTAEEAAEFQTDSQMFELEAPEFSPNEVNEALFNLRRLRVGSTNEGHVKDAIARVKGAKQGKGQMKYRMLEGGSKTAKQNKGGTSFIGQVGHGLLAAGEIALTGLEIAAAVAALMAPAAL